MNIKTLIAAVAACLGLANVSLGETETMTFPENTTSNLVLQADKVLEGLLFGYKSKVTISGDYTLTVNVADDKGLDDYSRLFVGDTELTVTDGADILINPKDCLQQSSNMKIVVEDGATFTNTKWGAGDNGGYVLVASNENSAITLDLISADSGNTNPGVTFTFIAQDGGKVEVNKKNNALMNVGAQSGQKLTAVADNGTVTLTGVKITGTATCDVTLKGDSTATLDMFTPAGGTLTLVADANWDDETPHLTTTGALSFGGELTIDVAALGEFTGEKKFLIGQAGVSATFNPSKVELKNGPDGYVATCSVEGKNVYVTVKDSAVITPYWRWTSNATEGDSAVWNVEDNGGALSVPNFEGATAEDNVIELLDDCTVTSFLVFNKSCTIRTNPECDVKKVTFAKNCYCISTAGADIHTADITFTGGAQWSYPTPQYQWFWNASAGNSTTAGNCAWAVIGTASLTLGAGTTVRDFLSAVPTGIGGTSYGAAIMLPDQTTKDSPLGQKNCSQDSPALTISGGVKILDVRSNNSPAIFIGLYSAKAVVTMTGGEISECYNGNGGPNYAGTIYVGNGTFNLSGGTIHGNYASSSDYAGINVYNGALLLSGTPIVQNNYKTNSKNVTSYHELRNLKVSGSGSIHLAGNLEEGADVSCSQNIGEGNQFGVADGKYRGANFIHADDGSELVGRVRQGSKLVWSLPSEKFLLFIR